MSALCARVGVVGMSRIHAWALRIRTFKFRPKSDVKPCGRSQSPMALRITRLAAGRPIRRKRSAATGPRSSSPGGDRDDHLVADGERPQMRGRVVLARSAVVAVAVGIPRRDRLLEPIENVLPEPRLVIVHEHRRRDVHRRDEHHALANPGRGATALDVVGDVDDLLALLRVEGEIVRVRLHVVVRVRVVGPCDQSVCLTAKPLSRASRTERL